ncbi:unnamed protein product [Linum tenue]|uniref:Uncharacterized protein n=1 Tax=Linum tenue TaxID=586396 RepID=A0AAV0KDK5_9ROSI|nr:unnamed protein product [Linum tenue]
MAKGDALLQLSRRRVQNHTKGFHHPNPFAQQRQCSVCERCCTTGCWRDDWLAALDQQRFGVASASQEKS